MGVLCDGGGGVRGGGENTGARGGKEKRRRKGGEGEDKVYLWKAGRNGFGALRYSVCGVNQWEGEKYGGPICNRLIALKSRALPAYLFRHEENVERERCGDPYRLTVEPRVRNSMLS